MIRSYQRGHEIKISSSSGDKWVYSDTGESADIERPCIKCGELPTAEGYDACSGYIDGLKSFCCGHGVHNPIKVKEERGCE